MVREGRPFKTGRPTLASSLSRCSAGIGRTGTIVVIDMILETIDLLGMSRAP